MTEEKQELTLEMAVDWTDKAKQLGYYDDNTARLLKTAAEAIGKIFGPDEPRTIASIKEREEQIYARLLKKSENLSATSAQTYMSRMLRLVRDFEAFTADPKGFTPSGRGRNDEEKEKPKRRQAARRPEEEKNEPETPGEYREHTISLGSGKATLKVPTPITLDELQLLMLVLGSHCPDAREAQIDWLKRSRAPGDEMARQ